jgi:hypothetical protein
MAHCIYRHMPNVYQLVERLAPSTLVPAIFVHSCSTRIFSLILPKAS